MTLTPEERLLLSPYLSAYPDDLGALYASSGAEPVPDEALKRSFDALPPIKLRRAVEQGIGVHPWPSLAAVAARFLAASDTEVARLLFAQAALAVGDHVSAVYWSETSVAAILDRPRGSDPEGVASANAGKLVGVAAKANLTIGNASKAAYYRLLQTAINLRDVDFRELARILGPDRKRIYAGSYWALFALAESSEQIRALGIAVAPETGSSHVRTAADAVVYGDYWRVAAFDGGGLRRDLCSGASAPVAVRQALGLLQPSRHFSGTTLLLHNTHGAVQYYHWMIQLLPRLGLALEEGARFDRLAIYGADKSFVAAALDRFGIPRDAVVDLRDVPCFSAERLIAPVLKKPLDRAMIDFVRATYLPDPAAVPRGAPIYISRKSAQSRRVANEEEVVAALSRTFGFVPVRFEEMTLAEQARTIAGAPCVVAPHGAGLSNICFCGPDALVVEMMPTQYNVCYEILARAAKLPYRHFETSFVNDKKDMLVDVAALVGLLKAHGLESAG